MQQQITRGDYLKDLITIYIENNLQTDITELYSQFIFQCGEIQKAFTPAQVIKISFSEQESLKLKNLNTCYLAGITVDGHKETFNGSLTFNTRGEVVNYEPTASGSVTVSGTTANDCGCQGLRGVFSNCCQPAIKAYFSLNYVPTKLSELQNDTDFQDSVDVANSIAEHSASTTAHPYIQSVMASATEALSVSIQAETTARIEAVSAAISTTEAYTDSVVTQATEATKAYADSIVSTATTATEAYTNSLVQSATTAINTTIGEEVLARQGADNNLQTQIDGLAAASDVTDIVGTYADLQSYDTQHLNNNDIIKVLSDETHDDEPSYYRFNKTAGTFSYIGSESAAYTKAQADAKFVTQTTTINGEALSQNITLTATEVGALPSTTTINDLTTTAQQNAINSTATTAKINQIATNTTNIASNTSAISAINGKIPTDASSTNKLVSASTLSASIANFANKDLNNLSTVGTQKLRSLNAYANEGDLLTDADGLSFVKNYAHSTFDRSKFTVVGSPVITDDGIASGFSSGNFIKTIQLSNLVNKSWKIKSAPIYFDGTNSSLCFAFADNGYASQGSVRLSSNNRVWFYGKFGTTGDISTEVFAINLDAGLQGGNWYYTILEFNYNTGVYTLSVYDFNNQLKASDTYTPTTTNKQLAYINDNPTKYITLGWVNGQGYAYSIDLKQFSITVDGVEVFSGNRTGIDTIKSDDYTVVGTPTISADGIASGFSSSDYLSIPANTIPLATSTQRHIIKAKLAALPQGSDVYALTGSSNNFGDFVIAFNSSDLLIRCRTTNASANTYDIQKNISISSLGTITNVDFTIEHYWNGITHTFNLIKDGVETSLYSGNISYPIGQSYALYLGYHNAWNYSNPSTYIDLDAFKIYVDGNLVYQPCLKIPYTESKTGSKIVDSIYRDRVADMSAQFGFANYYTLQDEPKGNYQVVGTPTISADGIASGFSNSNAIKTTLSNWDVTTHTYIIEMHLPNAVKANSHCFPISGGLGCWISQYNGKYQMQGWDGSANRSFSVTQNTFNDGDDLRLKIQYKLNDYRIQMSVNGGEYGGYEQNLTTNPDATSGTSTTIWIGSNYDVRYYSGSIDLKQFKIYVDNKLAYEAVIDPNFTLPQVELYGLIGQRTLRDSYRNGINYWELYSNRDLEQGGSCTSGVEVTFARPFADTNYVLSVPYSAKSATAFTPTASGDWIAKGKGIL